MRGGARVQAPGCARDCTLVGGGPDRAGEKNPKNEKSKTENPKVSPLVLTMRWSGVFDTVWPSAKAVFQIT